MCGLLILVIVRSCFGRYVFLLEGLVRVNGENR